MAESLWAALERWKKECRWIDLSLELSADTPHWYGFDPLASKALYTFEGTDNGFQAFQYTLSGQYGTHTDFPRHFDPAGRYQHEYGVKDMAYKLVVIDKSAEVAKNADYCLSRQDVIDFETAYGPVPEGSFAAFRSDWHKRAAAEAKDAAGVSHAPGWDIAALHYLIDERKVAAVGHETPDTDSAADAAAKGMVGEDFVLKRGKLNIELMAHLDEAPPTGAIIFVTFPNLKNGVGFNSRVFAIAPK
jgi:kynurenine formamidase